MLLEPLKSISLLLQKGMMLGWYRSYSSVIIDKKKKKKNLLSTLLPFATTGLLNIAWETRLSLL